MVLFQQFYYVTSFRQHALKVPDPIFNFCARYSCSQDSVTASIFLASKLLETPSNPQNIVNVLLTVIQEPLPGLFTQDAQVHLDALFAAEMHILKNLGFHVEVKLPYTLAINYLQILGLSRDEQVAQRVWNYCNDMYSSRFLYGHLADWIVYAQSWCVCILHRPLLALPYS